MNNSGAYTKVPIHSKKKEYILWDEINTLRWFNNKYYRVTTLHTCAASAYPVIFAMT